MSSHTKTTPTADTRTPLSDADKRLIDFLVKQAVKQAVKTCS